MHSWVTNTSFDSGLHRMIVRRPGQRLRLIRYNRLKLSGYISRYISVGNMVSLRRGKERLSRRGEIMIKI